MAVHAQDFALVVGLNHYPYYSDGKDLKGAIDDASKFADWLKDQHSGGGRGLPALLPVGNASRGPGEREGSPRYPSLTQLACQRTGNIIWEC